MKKQKAAFVDKEELTNWKRHWGGMPEFVQEDQQAFKQVKVSFACQEDLDAFAKLIGQKVLFTTRSIWFPKARIGRFKHKRYADNDATDRKGNRD